MSLRNEIRQLVIDAVKSAGTDAGENVFGPRDTPTYRETHPAVLIQAPRSRKESLQRGMPEFNTTVTVIVEGRVECGTAEDAQDQIEALADQIEVAILTYIPLVSSTQQFPAIDDEIKVTSEGRNHIGEVAFTFEVEKFEYFDPTENPIARIDENGVTEPDVVDSLKTVDIHVDLASPFDASGTYASPPFPAAVPPAPRTSGPDGRDEGALTLTNLDA